MVTGKWIHLLPLDFKLSLIVSNKTDSTLRLITFIIGPKMQTNKSKTTSFLLASKWANAFGQKSFLLGHMVQSELE